MDLDSRLANLSLGEIASLLSPKQQEVLLASISVAAGLIQQLQAEEQAQLQAEKRQIEQQQQQQQLLFEQLHQHQQQARPHNLHNVSSNTTFNNLSSFTSTTNTSSTAETNTTTDLDDEDEDESDDFDDTDSAAQNLHINSHNTNGNLNHHHHHHRMQQHSAYDDETRADKQDLITIRQFAEELKQRRKAIRLSQKGAAQSLRAFTGGDQPCTDAIIYHFENLQLEPERAMQLIPLLRDWLEWAEKHRFNGKQLPMMSAVTKVPRERKRKVVLFNEKSKQYLEDAFTKNNHPDRYQLDVISQELSIPTRSIRKWFTNRRQRKRFAEKFSAS